MEWNQFRGGLPGLCGARSEGGSGLGPLLKLLGSLTSSRPQQGLAEATFQKDLLSPAHPHASDPREDGKAREERGGRHKMEEGRLSYLVLMRRCPEPHHGSSTARPDTCGLPGPSHSPASLPLGSGPQLQLWGDSMAAAVTPRSVIFRSALHLLLTMGKENRGSCHQPRPPLDTQFSCHRVIPFPALDPAPHSLPALPQSV